MNGTGASVAISALLVADEGPAAQPEQQVGAVADQTQRRPSAGTRRRPATRRRSAPRPEDQVANPDRLHQQRLGSRLGLEEPVRRQQHRGSHPDAGRRDQPPRSAMSCGFRLRHPSTLAALPDGRKRLGRRDVDAVGPFAEQPVAVDALQFVRVGADEAAASDRSETEVSLGNTSGHARRGR